MNGNATCDSPILCPFYGIPIGESIAPGGEGFSPEGDGTGDFGQRHEDESALQEIGVRQAQFGGVTGMAGHVEKVEVDGARPPVLVALPAQALLDALAFFEKGLRGEGGGELGGGIEEHLISCV